MQIKSIKNRALRALIFCVSSSTLVAVLIHHQDVAAVLGIIFFTASLVWVFGNEKMIDLSNKRAYRFSFLRLMFNLENFAYNNLPERMKKSSLEIVCASFVMPFVFYTSEWSLLLVFIASIIVTKYLLIFYGR